MCLGGPPVFKSHLPGPSSRQRFLPVPEMLATGEDLCPQLWGAKPYSLALQPVPAGQEAKCTKILLIISLKRLRNKVVLFFFYNPSKKEFTLVLGPKTRPSPERSPGLSVETLVPLLPLLKHHGPHHSAHDDAQERAQQQQEHPPPRQGPAAEVSGRVIHIVWGRREGKLKWPSGGVRRAPRR